MPALQTLDAGAEPAYHKAAGAEPLPGYTLIEPLGRGGYGEVWRCEAPGGLQKAIKFVAGDPTGNPREASLLRQEFEAFQQVKAIRHPFLLCLERVELVDGELVMVMGLADKHVGDRFNECIAQGMPGIPRGELLRYLREAAEALDVIGDQYGLQHLDVKPANLFLTAGHMQVGDYGLVSKLDGGNTAGGKNRGLTPKYAAPEVLRGKVHTRSDQYSLALVYYELLTGAFPFAGRSAQQMMMQHMSAAPDLSAASEAERWAIGRALSKNPEDRFPSCLDFIDTMTDAMPAAPRLSTVTTFAPRPAPSGGMRPPTLRPQPPLSTPPTQRPLATPPTHRPLASPSTQRSLSNPPTHRPFAGDSTKQVSGTSQFGGMPRLVGVSKVAPRPAPPVEEEDDDCVPLFTPVVVRLTELLPVCAVGRLNGDDVPDPDVTVGELAEAVLAAAGYDPAVHTAPDAILRDATGAWVCRFPSSVDPRLGLMKLALIREEFGIAAESVDERRVVFRELAPAAGLFGFGKRGASGFEVAVHFPEPGGREADVLLTGHLFGKPAADFVRAAEAGIVRMMEAIRHLLHNVSERREHARVTAEFPLALYPLHSDGRVDEAVPGWSVNVSAGGVAVRAATFPPCKYLYVAFERVRGLEDVALLVQTVRRKEQPDGVLITGAYRVEE